MRQGWEIKKLGEVCKVIAGQSPEGKFYNSEGNGMPFYQGKKEYGEKYLGEPTTWTTKITKEAEAGDILMSVRAPVGPVNLATQKICIGRGLAAIRAGKNIDKEFLYNFLIKHENEIEGNAGAVFNSINKTQIENIEIPLPPLPEQQRIVSIIDEAFAAIAKAKVNAEQNLKNAKELFESYLENCLNHGLNRLKDSTDSKTAKSVSSAQSDKICDSDKWEVKKLGEIAEITDGDHMPPPKSEKGIPFITISNINKTNHNIDFSNTFKVPQNYFDNLKPNRKPQKGDVLYTVTGSYGIPVLVENDIKFCFQRHIGLIRPKAKLNSNFLYYWILTPNALFQANETATGTAQKTVSLTSLRNFTFLLPPLKAQQTIVRQLDALRAETQKLEAVYQKKIADLEELKKSILQKAFAGELKTEKALAI